MGIGRRTLRSTIPRVVPGGSFPLQQPHLPTLTMEPTATAGADPDSNPFLEIMMGMERQTLRSTIPRGEPGGSFPLRVQDLKGRWGGMVSAGVDQPSSLCLEIMTGMGRRILEFITPVRGVGGLFPLLGQGRKDKWERMEWGGEDLDLPLFQETMMGMGRPMSPFTRAAMGAGGSSTLPMEVPMAWAGEEKRPIFL